MARRRERGSVRASIAPRASWRTGWRLTLLAIAFAVGLTIGNHLSPILLWWWIALAVIALGFAAVIIRRSASLGYIGLLGAMLALGGAWIIVKQDRVRSDDLARRVSELNSLVRLRGTIDSPLMLRDRLSGSMGRFGFQPPATYFRVNVEALLPRDGAPVPASGQVLVRVNETMPPARIGDRVELLGSLTAFPPAANPGELDRAEYAAALGQAGLLRVPSRALAVVTPVSRSSFVDSFNQWRAALRHRASGWLKADLPTTERTERDALLAAMFLGERGPDLDGLDEAFRRTGLAHVLAISGLHLGVLAGVLLGAFRFTGRHRAWHAWAVIAVILFYLLLIEVRLPVLRAAVMITIACLGLAFARRFAFTGLISLSAIGLLLWRPDQLFEPGFQLSFGVVIGLVHFAMPLREFWWGPRDALAPSASAMAGEWLKDLVAASLVAWLISMPIIIHHFGVVTLLAAPASVVAIPIVTLLLAVGYLKMLLGVLLPSAGLVLGAALTTCAEFLISIVQMFDAIPATHMPVPGVSAGWTIAAIIVMVGWLTARTKRRAVIMLICTIALSAWALRPRVGSELRFDMLAVGDGTCILVRTGGQTMLFDAGSSTNLNAGRQSIVPALRRLGVHRIDGLIISHANLDHYAAAIEVIDAFLVSRVLVTPALLREAEETPNEALGFLVDAINRRAIAVQPVARGHEELIGETRWTWLHPPEQARFDIVNDTSSVIAIDAFGRRAMLTGDVQTEGMAMLLGRPAEDLRADVIEFPHHGSYHDAAIAFVEAVQPTVIMQSTGWTRWLGDRWGRILDDSGVDRLVTARDGAVWVRILDDGTIETGRFRE